MFLFLVLSRYDRYDSVSCRRLIPCSGDTRSTFFLSLTVTVRCQFCLISVVRNQTVSGWLIAESLQELAIMKHRYQRFTALLISFSLLKISSMRQKQRPSSQSGVRTLSRSENRWQIPVTNSRGHERFIICYHSPVLWLYISFTFQLERDRMVLSLTNNSL